VAHLSAKNNCLLRSWTDLRGTGCALWRLIVGKEPARLPLWFIVAPFATRSVRSQTQRPSEVPRPSQPVGGAVEPEQRIEERPGGVLPDSSSHCRSRWLRWVTALVRSLFDLSHWDVSLPKLEDARASLAEAVLSVRMRANAWLILLVSAPPTAGWREFLGLRSEPTGGVTPCSQFTPLSSSCASSLMEVWHPNQIPLILGWGLPREINLNNHFSYLAH